MTEPSGAGPEQLSHDSARALFERNYKLLNEHDARHMIGRVQRVAFAAQAVAALVTQSPPWSRPMLVRARVKPGPL
jgi:hypothetical protein